MKRALRYPIRRRLPSAGALSRGLHRSRGFAAVSRVEASFRRPLARPARPPSTQPTRIGHASLSPTPPTEICNTTRPVSTPANLSSPRDAGPIARRTCCCDDRLAPAIAPRTARPLLHRSGKPFRRRSHLRGEGPCGSKDPESRWRRAPVPHSSFLRACPRRPFGPRRPGKDPARSRTGQGSRSARTPRRVRTSREPGSFPLSRSRRGARIASCVRRDRPLPPPLFRATSEEDLRLWNRPSTPH